MHISPRLNRKACQTRLFPDEGVVLNDVFQFCLQIRLWKLSTNLCDSDTGVEFFHLERKKKFARRKPKLLHGLNTCNFFWHHFSRVFLHHRNCFMPFLLMIWETKQRFILVLFQRRHGTTSKEFLHLLLLLKHLVSIYIGFDDCHYCFYKRRTYKRIMGNANLTQLLCCTRSLPFQTILWQLCPHHRKYLLSHHHTRPIPNSSIR